MISRKMHKTKRMGPYFFSEPALNGKAYKNASLLCYAQEIQLSLISNFPGRRISSNWRYSFFTRRYLDTKLLQRIGKGGPIAWLARSPNLTPLHFFMWGRGKKLYYFCSDTIFFVYER